MPLGVVVSNDLVHWPLFELSSAIKAGSLSPVEVTEAVLTQIARDDASVSAYITVYHDEAVERAREAEAEIAAGRYIGPLHGIPMGIKDNLFVKDRTTTMGSKIHGAFVSEYDATVVSKLTAGGAILSGKLNLHEYALGVTTDNPHYGTCRNPWDLAKTPGGSSGGPGVAVQTGMSIGSLGSDTSGSIRIPAACCGIVGLKPTYGRVSKFGCFPEAWTLDHVGPMARTVRDVAILLDTVSGYDPYDPTSLRLGSTKTTSALSSDINGMVIGINESFFFANSDDSVTSLVWEGIRCLEEQGATVQIVDIPYIDSAEYALTIIDTSETSTVHHQSLRDQPQDLGDDVRYLIQCGELPSAIDYLEAQQIRTLLLQSFTETFDQVDVLIGPTLPIETPNVGQATSIINGQSFDTIESLMRLVGPANLLGLPSLSVPCGFVSGMPVGMQIIGPALGEQAVLNMGLAVEEAGLFVDADPQEPT